MTDILAGGLPEDRGFGGQFLEAERQVRAFLVTATRYVASGMDMVALKCLEAAAEDTGSMSADEFDRKLLKAWKNPGK
jgi:hypothetical protein